MTRAEFIERYRHRLLGQLAEAVRSSSLGGEQLGRRLDYWLLGIDQVLGEAHDALKANGTEKPVIDFQRNGKAR